MVPVFGQAIRYPPLKQQFGLGMGDFFALSSQYALYVGSPFIFGNEIGPKIEHYRAPSGVHGIRNSRTHRGVVGMDLQGEVPGAALETVSGIRPIGPRCVSSLMRLVGT